MQKLTAKQFSDNGSMFNRVFTYENERLAITITLKDLKYVVEIWTLHGRQKTRVWDNGKWVRTFNGAIGTANLLYNNFYRK